jgi:hypothetical protein
MAACAGAEPGGELLALKIRKQGRKMTSSTRLEMNKETRPAAVMEKHLSQQIESSSDAERKTDLGGEERKTSTETKLRLSNNQFE